MMKATYEELQLQLAEVVAENAALKRFPDQIIGFIGKLGTSEIGADTKEKIELAASRVKTPATDAYLAEVRVQVWIEGREPAEFGRYWVRYETDVGPRYCSAQWLEHNFCAGSNTNIHKIWLADHSRSMNSLRGVTHYTKLPESLEAIAAQLRQGAEHV